MKFRLPFDEAAQIAAGEAATQYNNDEPITQQQFAQDADLNEIVRRMGGLEATLNPEAPNPEYFGDFSQVPDLRTALDLVNDAQVKFRMLPSELRARFDNDPAKLWWFVNNPSNHEEAVRLGLLHKYASKAASKGDTPPPIADPVTK